MFRLYRKGGFKRAKSIPGLVKVLAFRMKHFQDLTWSPTPTKTESHDRIGQFDWRLNQGIPSKSRHRSDSRTSAQSPQPSPISSVYADYEENEAGNSWRNTAFRLEVPEFAESLIQVYPPSREDPNNRPLAIVTLKHLYEATDNVSPKTQILAALERARRYLARCVTDNKVVYCGMSSLQSLQFALVINLEGGRVTSTVCISLSSNYAGLHRQN